MLQVMCTEKLATNDIRKLTEIALSDSGINATILTNSKEREPESLAQRVQRPKKKKLSKTMTKEAERPKPLSN